MKLFRLLIICGLVLFACVSASGQISAPGSVYTSQPYKILKQPRAKFPKPAKKAGIQGAVRLRITLLASGELGTITDVTKERADEMVAWGFTESAIQAAKKIKFKPKLVLGHPVSVTVLREYTFTIY